MPPRVQAWLRGYGLEAAWLPYVSGRSRHWIKSKIRRRQPSNAKQRKIGAGERMLILQENDYRCSSFCQRGGAADFLVRLFTVLGWLYLWVGGGISAATAGIELRAIPNSRIPTPRSHSQ
jgi:hypothetical protein